MAFPLREFLKRFPDDNACLREIAARKGGFVCQACHHSKGYFLKHRPVIICQKCKHHYSPLKGTIFEKSRTPLTSWFYAIYMMTKTKVGVSAKQLQRELGVTYKTAWRMMSKIRSVMNTPTEKFKGEVEVDETFIGGKGKNRAKKYYDPAKEQKEVVMGVLDRQKKIVQPIHVQNLGRWTLLKKIQAHVLPKTTIFSDELASYKWLPQWDYRHFTINHRVKFVEGKVHTQNIENFWSHLKRGITGVYRAVSAKHLQAYANEFAFRYNHRKVGDERMFFLILRQAVKKKLPCLKAY